MYSCPPKGETGGSVEIAFLYFVLALLNTSMTSHVLKLLSKVFFFIGKHLSVECRVSGSICQ